MVQRRRATHACPPHVSRASGTVGLARTRNRRASGAPAAAMNDAMSPMSFNQFIALMNSEGAKVRTARRVGRSSFYLGGAGAGALHKLPGSKSKGDGVEQTAWAPSRHPHSWPLGCCLRPPGPGEDHQHVHEGVQGAAAGPRSRQPGGAGGVGRERLERGGQPGGATTRASPPLPFHRPAHCRHACTRRPSCSRWRRRWQSTRCGPTAASRSWTLQQRCGRGAAAGPCSRAQQSAGGAPPRPLPPPPLCSRAPRTDTHRLVWCRAGPRKIPHE